MCDSNLVQAHGTWTEMIPNRQARPQGMEKAMYLALRSAIAWLRDATTPAHDLTRDGPIPGTGCRMRLPRPQGAAAFGARGR